MTRRAAIHARLDQILAPFGLDYTDMYAKSHLRHVAWPKHMAFACLRSEFGMSFPQIGRFLGFDHTTIMNGVRRHEARMAWVSVLRFAADVGDQPDLLAAADRLRLAA
jgi:chromosomal replication initiation ATPase DnaA